MTEYFCSQCRNPCQPQLTEVGASADCCFEARLLTECKCGHIPQPHVRPLTPDEERELAYELHDEADAERTPAERARHRVMGEP